MSQTVRTLASQQASGCNDECVGGSPGGTTTSWNYVGEGKGGYAMVQNYAFVGEGSGAFEKHEEVVYYGCQPRWRTISGWLLLLVLGGWAGVCIMFRPEPTTETVTTTSNGTRPMTVVPVATVLPPPANARYHCTVPAVDHEGVRRFGDPGAATGAAIIQAAWAATDADGNDFVTQEELERCEKGKQLSASASLFLRTADISFNGKLDHDEFVAALIKAGYVRAPHGSYLEAVHGSVIEAAFILTDDDADGLASPGELSNFLDLEQHSLKGFLSRLWPTDTLQMLLSADIDGDKKLNRAEFAVALSKVGVSEGERAAKNSESVIGVAVLEVAWAFIDRDGDGLASKKELAVLDQAKLLPKRAVRLIHVADVDGEGTISKKEFEGMVDKAGGPVAVAAEATLEAWSKAKRVWCCTSEGIGCEQGMTGPTASPPSAETSPRPPEHAVEAPSPQPPKLAADEPTPAPAVATPAPAAATPVPAVATPALAVATPAPAVAMPAPAAPVVAPLPPSQPLAVAPQPTEIPPFDCKDGPLQEWVMEKRTWCCSQHMVLGCPAV
mmetsp:Transcript_116810/g.260895  ORF Transcript_116810/g.260895 Transcript_116810/m.260895 type:complete len:555 (+) Transcript_116810:109-1773(+)